MESPVKRALILALLLFCAAGSAAAQTELGTITGTIKDAQGAVLPGVTVTALNSATNYNPGFTLGGPVRLPKYDGRNKTFFFYAFEGLKSGIPVSSGERAPTDLERAGDFSQSGVTIDDPFNTVGGVPQPFPGNRIPAFQVRLELFNAFNGVQWGNPNTTITSAQFGRVTETQSNDPRFIQLAFRFSY